MATTAQFVSSPILEINQVSTANTARDGTGTTVLICSGPTFDASNGIGKRIARAIIHGVTGSSVGSLRFFMSTDSGSTKRLILEKSLPATAITPSTSAYRSEIPELIGLVLPGNSGGNHSQIYASTTVTDTFNIIIESGIL